MKRLDQLHWLFLLWTFPGVVIHELAHKEFCRYYKIPVNEVCYFQLDNPAGYVIHARPRSYIVAFMISIAPAIINTTLAFVSGMVFVFLMLPFGGLASLLTYPPEHLFGAFLAAWVGISAGVHALPSRQDAKEIWGQTRDNWYNPFVLAVIPIVLIIEGLNRLRALHIPAVAGIVMFILGAYTGVNLDVIMELVQEHVNMWLSS